MIWSDFKDSDLYSSKIREAGMVSSTENTENELGFNDLCCVCACVKQRD